MQVDVSVLVGVVSVSVALLFGALTQRRNARQDAQSEQASLTTVIVKLESIGNVCAEIKSDLGNVKNDVKENRERIIKLEASAKSAHHRLDGITGQSARRDAEDA